MPADPNAMPMAATFDLVITDGTELASQVLVAGKLNKETNEYSYTFRGPDGERRTFALADLEVASLAHEQAAYEWGVATDGPSLSIIDTE